MDTSSGENGEKDEKPNMEPRREVNSNMPGYELISENEKKVCQDKKSLLIKPTPAILVSRWCLVAKNRNLNIDPIICHRHSCTIFSAALPTK